MMKTGPVPKKIGAQFLWRWRLCRARQEIREALASARALAAYATLASVALTILTLRLV
jgi:hypothetical protein